MGGVLTLPDSLLITAQRRNTNILSNGKCYGFAACKLTGWNFVSFCAFTAWPTQVTFLADASTIIGHIGAITASANTWPLSIQTHDISSSVPQSQCLNASSLTISRAVHLKGTQANVLPEHGSKISTRFMSFLSIVNLTFHADQNVALTNVMHESDSVSDSEPQHRFSLMELFKPCAGLAVLRDDCNSVHFCNLTFI